MKYFVSHKMPAIMIIMLRALEFGQFMHGSYGNNIIKNNPPLASPQRAGLTSAEMWKLSLVNKRSLGTY